MNPSVSGRAWAGPVAIEIQTGQRFTMCLGVKLMDFPMGWKWGGERVGRVIARLGPLRV